MATTPPSSDPQVTQPSSRIVGPVNQVILQQSNPAVARAYTATLVAAKNDIVATQTAQLEATQGYPATTAQIAGITAYADAPARAIANDQYQNEIEAAKAAQSVPENTPPPTVAPEVTTTTTTTTASVFIPPVDAPAPVKRTYNAILDGPGVDPLPKDKAIIDAAIDSELAFQQKNSPPPPAVPVFTTSTVVTKSNPQVPQPLTAQDLGTDKPATVLTAQDYGTDPQVPRPLTAQDFGVDKPATTLTAQDYGTDPQVPRPLLVQDFGTDKPAPILTAQDYGVDPKPPIVQNYFTNDAPILTAQDYGVDPAPPIVQNYFTNDAPVLTAQDYGVDTRPLLVQDFGVDKPLPILTAQDYGVDTRPLLVQDFGTDKPLPILTAQDYGVDPQPIPIIQNYFTDPVLPISNLQVPQAPTNIFTSLFSAIASLFSSTPTPVPPASNPQVARPLIVQDFGVDKPTPVPPASNPQVARPLIVQDFGVDKPAPILTAQDLSLIHI